ncbi:MAG: hypothetical protein APF76_00500 [Desulfitibacter sp. BRH_c19]|nr:MAG: hypothetical protein APF76_00500 [Desulfitibacter sp. BRH_c19]
MSSFLLAFSFLTIIPAYGSRVAGEKDMANSLYFYPLVGLLIGGFLALMAYASDVLSLGLGGDALIVVIWIILTGGLHMDGVMDSADGLFSGRDRERKLEILKDSRVGAMGVIALGAVLLLKFSFLVSLPFEHKLWALFLAPAVGRTAMVYSVLYFPYARSKPGLGKCFGENVGRKKFYGAAAITLVAAFMVAGSTGVTLVLTSLLIAAIIAKWFAWILGGQTGDTYGALCEVLETIFLILIVIVIGVAGFYGS